MYDYLTEDELKIKILNTNILKYIYWNERYVLYKLTKCPYCNKNVNNSNSLMTHLRYHKEFCDSVGVKTRVGFEYVPKNIYKEYECEYCKTKYHSYKSLIGHYPYCINRLKIVYKDYINQNPILKLITDPDSESTKSLVARELNFVFPIKSLKYYRLNDLILGKYKLSISLMYYIDRYPEIHNYFINYFKLHTTWDLANELNMNQLNISRIFGSNGLNLVSKSKSSSKIHLSTKPIIEKIIGYNTITEYYLNGYWIDEYCKELNIGFEIDGEWCHDKDYDSYRDSHLNSLGVTIIRIPAYSTELDIIDILNRYKLVKIS